jgi:hypothetical protein
MQVPSHVTAERTFTPGQRGVMVLRLPSTPELDFDSMPTIERQPDRIWE